MDLNYYGHGQYIEDKKVFHGDIVLSEHKLYLISNGEDLTQTYIPLEKIQRIKKSSSALEIKFRTNVLSMYQVRLKAEKKDIDSLASEIIFRRRLKKRLLSNEWVEA
jgi:hypothetical protein